MNDLKKLVGALGLGAGVMYFFDPARGDRRRALVRDQVISAWSDSEEFLQQAADDLRNRTQGVLSEISAGVSGETAPDPVIQARVRSALGRVSRHPGSIEVEVHNGQVALSGPILADEVDRVVSFVRNVRGVASVENRMQVFNEPGDVPGLQGDPAPRGPRPEFLQENWAPAPRLLAILGGGLLALRGLARGGVSGKALGVVGAGLAARGITNIPLRRLIGTGAGRRAIEVQKTINIQAPVEEVYRFWSNFENFPHFMAHVKEVSTSNGVSHWTAAGPAGMPVEWDAVVTKDVPNEVLAWKSAPGEVVKSAGIVQFRPNADGGTRVTVRMSYNPPTGALGHTVATLFGVDPKSALDEDLLRMKSMIEVGEAGEAGE